MLKICSTNDQHKGIRRAKRFYFKAQDALKAGKLIKAIQYLNQSIQIKDDYQPAYRELAEIYQQHGDLNEAQKYIQKSLQIDPEDPVSLFIQGVIHITKGEITLALKSFNMVLKYGEMTWGLAYNLGLCHYGLKEFDLSAKFLNIAIEKDPSQPQSFMLLAQIFIMQNKIDTAKELLMRAKRIRPHDPQLDLWFSNILDPKDKPRE